MKTHNLISSRDHDLFVQCIQELEKIENTHIIKYELDPHKKTKHGKPFLHLNFPLEYDIRGVYCIWMSESSIELTRKYLYVGTTPGKNDIMNRLRVFVQCCIGNENPHISHAAADLMKWEFGESKLKSIFNEGKINVSVLEEEFIESIFVEDIRTWRHKSQQIERLLCQRLNPKFNSNKNHFLSRGTNRSKVTNTLNIFFNK